MLPITTQSTSTKEKENPQSTTKYEQIYNLFSGNKTHQQGLKKTNLIILERKSTKFNFNLNINSVLLICTGEH